MNLAAILAEYKGYHIVYRQDNTQYYEVDNKEKTIYISEGKMISLHIPKQGTPPDLAKE